MKIGCIDAWLKEWGAFWGNSEQRDMERRKAITEAAKERLIQSYNKLNFKI